MTKFQSRLEMWSLARNHPVIQEEPGHAEGVTSRQWLLLLFEEFLQIYYYKFKFTWCTDHKSVCTTQNPSSLQAVDSALRMQFSPFHYFVDMQFVLR